MRMAESLDCNAGPGSAESFLDGMLAGEGTLFFDGKRFSIVSCSDGFFSLIGYTREEYQALPLRSDGLRIAFEEDIRRAMKIDPDTPCFSVRLRLCGKDGSIRCLWVQGHLEAQEQGTHKIGFFCTDITPLQVEMDALAEQCRRYGAVFEMTGDILFECDLQTGLVQCFGNAANRFGLSSWQRDYRRLLQPGGPVCERDAGALASLIKRLEGASLPAVTRLRLKRTDGRWVWHEITASCFIGGDSGGKVLGRAADIDRQMRQLRQLATQAERDSLTGLYNNTAAKRMISECLSAEPDGRHLMMVADLDDFKAVNDRFGHAAGDRMLRRTADILRGCFRGSDIIGRFGGDEFVVLMRHTARCAHPREKVAQACAALRSAGGSDGLPAVTASIGAAVFPDDGKTFEKLFERADLALYHAKHKGKGMFSLYGEE